MVVNCVFEGVEFSSIVLMTANQSDPSNPSVKYSFTVSFGGKVEDRLDIINPL